MQSLAHFIEDAENGHMQENYAVGLVFLFVSGSNVDAEAAAYYLKEAALFRQAVPQLNLVIYIFESG